MSRQRSRKFTATPGSTGPATHPAPTLRTEPSQATAAQVQGQCPGDENASGRTEVSLIPRIGFTILKVTLPFLVDPTKPDAARVLALQHARAQGIDVSDYEAA